MTLGIESMRSGFGNPHSAETSKKAFMVQFEKYCGTNLDNAGESLRDGQSFQVIFADAGYAGNVAEKCYLHLRHTAKIQIKTGVVRLVE